MKRILVLFNPASHKASRWRHAVEDIQKVLVNEGNEVEWIETEAPGQIEQLARRAPANGYDIVVAMGGDGTVNEVVNALAGTGLLIGIIPFGISNVFALEAGIPLNPVRAARNVLNGRTKYFDLGVVNGRKFMLMFGAGLDALAVFHYRPKLKKFMNKYAYIAAGVKVFFKYSLNPLKITLLDHDMQLVGYQVIISNCRFYGGRLRIAPEAVPYDGWLDAVVFRNGSPLHVLKYFVTILIGKHYKLPDVSIFRTKSIKVEGDSPYHIDSEPVGRLPADITVMPKSVKIIVPRRRIG